MKGLQIKIWIENPSPVLEEELGCSLLLRSIGRFEFYRLIKCLREINVNIHFVDSSFCPFWFCNFSNYPDVNSRLMK